MEGPPGPDGNPMKLEYRVWNPFRSKLAAAILGGIDSIHMKPGSKVLYLGAAAGTTVSHVSDIVGPTGMFMDIDLIHYHAASCKTAKHINTNTCCRHQQKVHMFLH